MPDPKGRPRSSIYLTNGEITKLRNLAERLGYFQTRGVGTGEAGSVSAFLAALAAAATYNPGDTEKALRELFATVSDLPATIEDEAI